VTGNTVDISGADLMSGIHPQYIRVKLDGNNFYLADSESVQTIQVSKIVEKAVEFLLSA
jgi:hypothetical protein